MDFLKRLKIAAFSGAAGLMLAIISLATGCERGPSPAATPGDDSAPGTSSPPTAELSGDQLNAIKMGTVEVYAFPREVESVGSIFFGEDPSLIQAESTLAGASVAEDLASKVLARAQALYETNGVSLAELDQDVATEKTSKAALKAARDAVRALNETDAQIGQILDTGKIPAAQGEHSSLKWARANIDEDDSPSIQPGQPVKVRVAAFPNRIYDGSVSKVYPNLDSNTHRMAVRVEVTDTNNDLRVGMLATMTIEVSKPLEAVAIPANGVVREGDGTMTAWVTSDRRHFTQRIIATGLRENGEVQVLSGLQPGELVVTDGAVFIDNMLFAPPTD